MAICELLKEHVGDTSSSVSAVETLNVKSPPDSWLVSLGIVIEGLVFEAQLTIFTLTVADGLLVP